MDTFSSYPNLVWLIGSHPEEYIMKALAELLFLKSVWSTLLAKQTKIAMFLASQVMDTNFSKNNFTEREQPSIFFPLKLCNCTDPSVLKVEH